MFVYIYFDIGTKLSIIASKLGPIYRMQRDTVVNRPDKFWSVYGYDYSEYSVYHGYHVNRVKTGEYCNIDDYNMVLHVCQPAVGKVSVCIHRRGYSICTE